MTFGTTLNGANALVVGASQGIGLGFVDYLLQDKRFNHVFGTYRRADTAAGLLALQQSHPERLSTVSMDITQEDRIQAAIATLQQQVDSLHLVVNCVGLLHSDSVQPEKSLRQLQADQLLQYFHVNSIGAALLAKYLLPLLKHDQPSLFATISAKIGSIGDNGLGGWYGYRASKAALNMLIKTASIEYSRKSPKTILTLLHPGTTDTRLSAPFQRNVPPEKLFSVERTVSQLMAVIESAGPEDSGAFFSWDGSRLPW